jgi:endoglucanase
MRGGGKRGGAPVAELLGGAPLSAAAGARVRFFDRQSGSANATARIVRTLAPERAGDPPLALLTDLAGVPRAGDPGMWDLTPGRIAPGGRLSSRACDDLVGAAAILAVLEILTRAGQRGATFGIFTRAEETGFVGCLGLVQSGALPPGTQVVGLECSPARAAARLGAGPVIRVGDAASVFDPELTRLLEDAAARLARADARFRFQRALMDGGRCESTAYNANGVRAGALCLALANYHNRGPRATIAAERVDWNDLEGLVALMLEAARGFGARRTYPLRQRLATLWRAGRARLARTAVGESR